MHGNFLCDEGDYEISTNNKSRDTSGESLLFTVWCSRFASCKCGKRKDGCHGSQHPSNPECWLPLLNQPLSLKDGTWWASPCSLTYKAQFGKLEKARKERIIFLQRFTPRGPVLIQQLCLAQREPKDCEGLIHQLNQL